MKAAQQSPFPQGYPRPEITQRSPSKLLQQLLHDLDLAPIRAKFESQLAGFNRESFLDQVPFVELRYRRFLYLAVTSGSIMVPTEDIDSFWHLHILDTRKYASDCEVFFGFFLHHFPYLGLRGKQDLARLQECFMETSRLYYITFHEDYAQDHEPSDCG